MAELGNVLAVVLAVNAMLFLGQIAALEMNPEGPQFYNCAENILGGFEASNCATDVYVLNDADPSGQLPSSGSEIEVDSGNVFTDTFSAAVSWFTGATGLTYLYNVLSAPSNFLKAIGLPDAFAFAVGAMWYGFTLLTIVAFVLGRDY